MYAFHQEIENEFVEKVLPIDCVSRGILPSEGFAFCAYCRQYNIDMIIESGVYNGQSTLIWSKFFGLNTQIVAVDRELLGQTVKKFNHLDNVIMIKGDGRELLRYLIKVNPASRIAIFIDGPKGEMAIALARKCFESENVFVAAIHDTHKLSFGFQNKTRTIVDSISDFKFHSDDKEFVKKYKYMDRELYLLGEGDEAIYWVPYKLIDRLHDSERSLGSYGPTVSIMSKDL